MYIPCNNFLLVIVNRTKIKALIWTILKYHRSIIQKVQLTLTIPCLISFWPKKRVKKNVSARIKQFYYLISYGYGWQWIT